MLNAIHAVDWKSLNTLEGSPEEIPLLLHKMTFPDYRAWYPALLRLKDLLLPNEIDYYPAMCTALPVTTEALLTLLFDTEIASRPRILWLLGDIVNMHILYLREDRSYQASEKLILAELNRYIPLLSSRDRRMRIAAAYVLSTIASAQQTGNERTQIQDALMQRLRIERSVLVIPALLFAIFAAYNGDNPDVPARLFSEIIVKLPDARTRWVAALGICSLTTDPPSVCTDVLEEASASPHRARWFDIYLNMRFNGSAHLIDQTFYGWFQRHYTAEITAQLCRLSPDYLDRTIRIFINFVQQDNQYTIQKVTFRIVEYLFQDIMPDRWIRYEYLNVYQRLIILAIYGNECLWNTGYGSIYFFFKDLGLPGDRDWWRKFIYDQAVYET